MDEIVVIQEIDQGIIIRIQRTDDLQSEVSLSVAISAVLCSCRDERNLRMIKQDDGQVLPRYVVSVKYNDPSRDCRKTHRAMYKA